MFNRFAITPTASTAVCLLFGLKLALLPTGCQSFEELLKLEHMGMELESSPRGGSNTMLVVIAFVSVCWWVTLSYLWGPTRKLSHIPTIGPTFPLVSYIGTIKYLFNAKTMVDEGLKKWPRKLFKIPEMFQWTVVIADPRMVDEVIRAPDSVMSAKAANDELVQMKFTMGEAITGNPYHFPLLRNELRKALVNVTPDIHAEVVDAFNELIPPTDDWNAVKFSDAVMQIVCRASNYIFVGRSLCRDPRWITINIKFTLDAFMVAMLLHIIPTFLRSLVNRLISKIPKHEKAAVDLLRPIFETRRNEHETIDHEVEKSPNMITWLMNLAEGEETADEALTMRILAINFGAIHTTSMSFTHALYYLATNPEFARGLREEVDEVVKKEGWTKEGLDQMERIDSFIRESQRMSSLSNLVMNRLLLKDYTFYDGTTIPSGSTIAVCMRRAHFDPGVYKDPMTFDPLRFVKLKAANTEKQYGIISSSADSLAFGHGRHACPGRYLAASEMKLMLAHLVSTYDVKLEQEGMRPADLWIMTSCVPNQNAVVFFRKRKDQ